MVKCSKASKQRIKRMSQAERKTLVKAASLLADNECISSKRYDAIARTAGFNPMSGRWG